MSEWPHIAAHRHCIRHRTEILASDRCGCFYCLATFAPAEVRTWLRETGKPRGRTALCPSCDIDAVIGSASGYPITPDFLSEMQRHWFMTGSPDQLAAEKDT